MDDTPRSPPEKDPELESAAAEDDGCACGRHMNHEDFLAVMRWQVAQRAQSAPQAPAGSGPMSDPKFGDSLLVVGRFFNKLAELEGRAVLRYTS